MIGYVRGELVELRPGKAVIDVNGIGYNVFIPESMREDLPSIGNTVKLYTYTCVREDAVSLFGFVTRDSLDMFNLLLSVNGVGPKGALMILSAFNVNDIKYAIITENSTLLSKAPTIGKKTAERIIVDLKDKISKDELLDTPSGGEAIDNGTDNPNAKDAVDALVALGYDRKESLNAVSMIENIDNYDTNAILKLALKYLI